MPIIRRHKWDSIAERAYQAWERDRPEVIAVDTETTGLAFYDEAFCATVAWEGQSHYFELSDANAWATLSTIMISTPGWVFHHAKFDLQKLILAGIIRREDVTAVRIEDTEAMAHLLDENRKKALKYLAHKLLGESTNEEKMLKVLRRKLKLKKEDGFHVLPRWAMYRYALKDAEFTFRLWRYLNMELCDGTKDDLVALYRKEMELTLVLLDMEAKGMGIDEEYVTTTLKEYGDKLYQCEKRIEAIVGKPIGPKVKEGQFNPASPQQVSQAFADRGVRLSATDKAALKACKHPLAKELLEYRSVAKLRSTYLLPMKLESRDGIIHPHFRQHGTKTGRMSSGGADN